jgi:hypothetical protein
MFKNINNEFNEAKSRFGHNLINLVYKKLEFLIKNQNETKENNTNILLKINEFVKNLSGILKNIVYFFTIGSFSIFIKINLFFMTNYNNLKINLSKLLELMLIKVNNYIVLTNDLLTIISIIYWIIINVILCLIILVIIVSLVKIIKLIINAIKYINNLKEEMLVFVNERVNINLKNEVMLKKQDDLNKYIGNNKIKEPVYKGSFFRNKLK